MSKQILIIVLVMLAVALAGGAAFWKGGTTLDESVMPTAKIVQPVEQAVDDAATASETAADPTPAAKPGVKHVSITIYEDAASGEELEVALADDESTVTLSGIGFNRLVLVSIASVSGSKYENAEQKIVFWEKDGHAAVYRGDKKIFAGSIQ
ncbi:MAG: MliC family protein [Candidatus Moranbacteria bacterium]|nr:MliC family protein [Candidatus Moranbacteria bacterium]MBP6033897.1 MliC family protein [Candidatus Moranbacteria bacterium]MBP7695644.1 MliC family protein [Candidatus Moranbacteria bacterium]